MQALYCNDEMYTNVLNYLSFTLHLKTHFTILQISREQVTSYQ